MAPLLAPLGRAEPDDLRGWLEHGGLVALQRGLALSPAALRTQLAGLPRRDGGGPLFVEAGRPAALYLPIGTAPDPIRLLLTELPGWLVAGAWLLARATEQRYVTLHLDHGSGSHRVLLREVIAGLEALGILGARGWAGGIVVALDLTAPPATALDGVTAALLPHVVALGRDPGTTLVARDATIIETPFIPLPEPG